MDKNATLKILKASGPSEGANRGVVTVIGKDKVGIIAGIAQVLADQGANIADISQTVLNGIFTMNMIVDLGGISGSFQELSQALEGKARQLGIKVYVHKEEVFNFMHTI